MWAFLSLLFKGEMMNLIDNGVEKFISFEVINDGERLGYEVKFVDYYGVTCKKLVTTMGEVRSFQDCKASWVE